MYAVSRFFENLWRYRTIPCSNTLLSPFTFREFGSAWIVYQVLFLPFGFCWFRYQSAAPAETIFPFAHLALPRTAAAGWINLPLTRAFSKRIRCIWPSGQTPSDNVSLQVGSAFILNETRSKMMMSRCLTMQAQNSTGLRINGYSFR